MLDMKFVRENMGLIKQAIKEKNEKVDIDEFLELDTRRRELIQQSDLLRQEKKKLSQQVGSLKKTGQVSPELIENSKLISQKDKQMQDQISEIESNIHDLLMWIPNIPHPDIPRNKTAEVREHGDAPDFDFPAVTADELCKTLGIVDFNSGNRIAGSSFPCYKGLGARLERALINFMLDLHLKQGYTEVLAPFVVNPKAMFGTAQLPKMEEDMYFVEKDNLFLNPTTEVALINLHNGDTLHEENLPINYTGYSASFRREAGSYGKETKGLKRVHQFNEVELIKFAAPDNSYEELEKMLEDAEEVLKLLGLRYRIILLSANELSFASTKTYDIEAWAPVTKEWLEVSSCSNCEDFQARRANIKLRGKGGSRFPHILNGTGLATPRTFIALVEHYQQEDGSIIIPDVLVPYMGGLKRIGP
jgi:seryl-tRNA synthetase